jgi:hypothetical protein
VKERTRGERSRRESEKKRGATEGSETTEKRKAEGKVPAIVGMGVAMSGRIESTLRAQRGDRKFVPGEVR